MAGVTSAGVPQVGIITSAGVVVGGSGSSSATMYEAKGTGSNANGSTNTRIRRWDTRTSDGAELVWTDDSADGSYLTVTTAGIVAVTATFVASGTAATVLGINTAAALSNTYDGAHLRATQSFVNGVAQTATTWVGEVSASDLIWISTFTASATGGTSTSLYRVDATWLGAL